MIIKAAVSQYFELCMILLSDYFIIYAYLLSIWDELCWQALNAWDLYSFTRISVSRRLKKREFPDLILLYSIECAPHISSCVFQTHLEMFHVLAYVFISSLTYFLDRMRTVLYWLFESQRRTNNYIITVNFKLAFHSFLWGTPSFSSFCIFILFQMAVLP